MRNWQKTLRRASYRGVPFLVSVDELTGGKRLAQHKYAGGRFTFVEEMGLETSGLNVTGYLLGDASDFQSTALVVALQAPGPGLLMLPVSGVQLATMETFGRLWDKDQLGYIAVSMSFLPALNSPVAAIGIGDVLSAVSFNLPSAVLSFARMF